MLLIITKLQKW